MLEILKGKSVKTYENEFFRKIASELYDVFERKSWDGMLIGMPECITQDGLQIDCILLTRNQIIIIDFKNYKGVLTLPAPDEFSSGRWMLDNQVVVRGGSARNPYAQLQRQRARLAKELYSRIQRFDKNTVSTMVCFHESVQIIGEIPRKSQLSFSIVDSTNFLNKIVDIVDVIGHKELNYLSDTARRIFTKTVFNADSYHFNEPILKIIQETNIDVSIPYKNHIDEIHNFLCSDKRIMTITGNTGSGKTAWIPQIRDSAFDLGFVHVPVLAYSNRLKQKMLRNHPGLEEVESLFSFIFDFDTENRDENYKRIVPVKPAVHFDVNENLTSVESTSQDRTLYVIDDSQLISNSVMNSDDIQYGSGRLLNDFLKHVNLEGRPNVKVIFIGDTNKLSFGKDTETPLNTNYIQTLLKERSLISEVAQLELPDHESEQGIVNACNQISKQIKSEQYSHLYLPSSKEISVNEYKDKKKIMEITVENPYSKKIVVHTNKEASDINKYIKTSLLKNGPRLEAGDFIIFNSSCEARQSQSVGQNNFLDEISSDFIETRKILNGTFGEILRVDYQKIIEKSEVIEEEKVTLRFIPCKIKLKNGNIVHTLVFENLLNVDSNELGLKEKQAYHMILKKLENNAREMNPFNQSREFEEMLAHPKDYVEIMRDEKVFYRKPEDLRKLTDYENIYRKRIQQELNHPGNEYFKILNVARIKLAWALTVHKAMVYTFDEVFFITGGEDRGRDNKAYFKWVYTGISTGFNKVNLINWKPILPFKSVAYSEEPLQEKYKETIKKVLFTFPNDESPPSQHILNYLNNRLNGFANIISFKSSSYQELVTLDVEKELLELKFHYTGKRQVRPPELKSGNEMYFKKISLLLNENPDQDLGTVKPALDYLKDVFHQKCIYVQNIFITDYQISLELREDEKIVQIKMFFKEPGMITKFFYSSGNVELYRKSADILRQSLS